MTNLTVKELKEKAKAMKISGWWNMTKTQLIEAIENQQTINDTESKIEKMIEATLEDGEFVPEASQDDEEANAINNQEIAEKADQADPEQSEDKPHKKNQKRLLTYNGKTQTLTAWSKELGIRHQTLYNRIVMKGWDVDKAFETPIKKGGEKNVG